MRISVILMIAASLAACSGKAPKETHAAATPTGQQSVPLVEVAVARTSPFAHAIVSNGKIRAGEVTQMSFTSAEPITAVNVRNGQRVARGQVLAAQDASRLLSQRESQAAQVRRAILDMHDVLIGQGYDPADTSAIPQRVRQLARVRSGLDQAEAAYRATVREIDRTRLRAPHPGVVANVDMAAGSMPSGSHPACAVINDAVMTIEFPVLENEVGYLSTGTPVEVTANGTAQKFTAAVSEINPAVDENGRIMVKARINSPRGLIDGMSGAVTVRARPGSKLTVPKTAVVLRSGRQVAFTLADGRAQWHYVTTGAENIDSYEITSGLAEGDTVIVSGNTNLAHRSPVTLR